MAAFTLIAAAHAALAAAPVMTCAGLAKVAIANTQIISTAHNASSSSLPAYCNVVGVINKRVSTQDPDHYTYGIVFELNLPDSWAGRFELMGGGGTDGYLLNPTGYFGNELADGWAVAIDDGGHENGSFTAVENLVDPSIYIQPAGVTWNDTDDNFGGQSHFGVDEQARVDFGYNAIHQTGLVSQTLITMYYGSTPAHSYVCGCSNGGRDAMMATQRFPQLFDGAVAVDPVFDLPQLAIAGAWNEQTLASLTTSIDLNLQPNVSSTFSNADLAVASAAMLAACDGLDGLVDGMINNVAACTTHRVAPILNQYVCSPTGAHGSTPGTGQCITQAQVNALLKIYGGPKNWAGQALYSNWYWDAGIYHGDLSVGWGEWNVTFPLLGFILPGLNTSLNSWLQAGSLSTILTTPPTITTAYSWTNSAEGFLFDFNFNTQANSIYAETPAYPQSTMSIDAANSPNLSAFRRRDGKLIVIESVNDGVQSGASLVRWYRQVLRENASARGFARVFLVPNMGHCGGGPATTNFNANAFSAITAWVENGRAPASIVASNTDTSMPYPSGAPFNPEVAQNFPTGGTRPLCPYPEYARYNGTGPTGVASSFSCANPSNPESLGSTQPE